MSKEARKDAQARCFPPSLSIERFELIGEPGSLSLGAPETVFDGTLYASEFGQDGFIDPVQQWAPEDASPSGIAVAVAGDSILIANLRGERVREVPLADLTTSTEHLVAESGRPRDVVVAPDGSAWVMTNNTDGRGDPRPDDDRILRISID